MTADEQPYRRWVDSELQSFRIHIGQSDLYISAECPIQELAERVLRSIRGKLESYIERDARFSSTLEPHLVSADAPEIVKEMAQAARVCNVGPMAAVAGAVAQHLGLTLLKKSKNIIVENGGDIFIYTDRPRVAAIFAGNSPLSGKIGVRIERLNQAVGLCTSSGTVGPSLSMGRADAAVILAESAILADAAATMLGNKVKEKKDIEPALESLQSIKGIAGGAIILQESLGVWGEFHLVRL